MTNRETVCSSVMEQLGDRSWDEIQRLAWDGAFVGVPDAWRDELTRPYPDVPVRVFGLPVVWVESDAPMLVLPPPA
jgi:hypothetical protein